MRVLLFLVLCCFSFSSFAQNTTFPVIPESEHKFPSYNRPDLKVLSIQLGGMSNGRQTLLITVRNNGNKLALPCLFNVLYTWRSHSKARLEFFSFGQGLPGIRPYKNVTITTVAPPGFVLYNYTPLSGGSVDLKIEVDGNDQNFELSESNNTYIRTFGFSN